MFILSSFLSRPLNSIAIPSLLLVVALHASAATAAGTPSQKAERDGVSVEFLPIPAGSHDAASGFVEGEDLDLKFSIRGGDGSSLTGIRPAAWIDARDPKAKPGDRCAEKVQSFLSGSLRARPQVDLNAYYVVTLNAEPSIAVLDPILGFGGSKLLTAVTLQSPGADWVLTRDQKLLFVSMPLVNRVAVIDTATWTTIKNIDTGAKPGRLALAQDDARLWVLHQNEDASDVSVTVVDTRSLAAVHTIRTGSGPHQIAFAAGEKLAVVSNGAEGNISVIDAATFARIGEVRTGGAADGIAVSTLGTTIYVIDGREGTISVVDPAERTVIKRIAAKPGLNSIQFAPGGRWGFVTNGKENAVHVIDASTASLIATVGNVGSHPDQIAFTDEFAYVRAAGSDHVKMIRLAELGTGMEPSPALFPAGQLPPEAARAESFAAAIVPAPEPRSVLVANPADRLIYYYTEGMAAPMGNFTVARRTPRAALVIDRSLRESDPGVFSIRTRVEAAGSYDVAFFLNSPRIVHCFELAVLPNPKAPPKAAKLEVNVEPLLEPGPVPAGGELDLRFRITERGSGQPQRGVRDLRVLSFLAPGVNQRRTTAEPVGDDGTYRVQFPVPDAGIYYVFVESASLNLRINESRPFVFEAVAKETTQP